MRGINAVLLLALAFAVQAAFAAPATRTGALVAASDFPGMRTAHTGIYRFDADGSHSRQLTRRRPDVEPAWSPNGRSIAFARFLPTGATQLWVMRGDGGGRHRLTRRQGGWPSWSPDGRRVAFVSARANLWTIGSNGKRPHLVIRRSVEADAPAWSPRGDRIAFVRGPALYTVTPAGRKLRALTKGRAGDFGPAWSPDGTRIAFVRTAARATDGRLWIIDVRTRHVHRVKVSPMLKLAPLARPAWSPDGRSIAVAGSRARHAGVYVVPARGGKPKLVAPHMTDPSWQALR